MCGRAAAACLFASVPRRSKFVLAHRIHEVAPGRPWELVLPPAERVADWNKKMGKLVLAAKR